MGLAILSAGCISQEPQQPPLEKTYTDQLTAAKMLTENVSRVINNMGSSLEQTAKTIANDPTNTTLVTQEYNRLYLSYHSVETLLVIDKNKHIIDIFPKTENDLQFAKIIDDPHFNFSADSPVVSTVNFWYDNHSIMLAVLPMFSDENIYQGLIAVVIDPSLFYESSVYSFQQATGYNAWIVDEVGKILYYPDKTIATDANILQLKSPNQTELEKVLQTILTKKSGVETYSAYSYGKLKIVTDVAAWDTITPYKNSKNYSIIVVTSEVSSTQQVTYPTKSANVALEEFVNTARIFASVHGKEAALKEFNNPVGAFTTKEYYITAFDMNGTLLANPYQPNVIGSDRKNFADVNGVHTVRIFHLRANQGGGYVTHVYLDPVDNTDEIKVSYVLPVDDDWYITAGEYHHDITATVPPTVRSNMVQYAREIEIIVRENGIENATALLNNDTNSSYRDMTRNVLTYNGVSLVSNLYPDLVGTDILGITDIYGTSIGRELVSLAKEGRGFMYINMPYPNGKTNLSLFYLEPIDDEMFAVVGVPLGMIG